ncbi:hypothetical protein SPARM206S_06502 [Streptomyces parvulus]
MTEHLDGVVIQTGFDVPVEPLRRAAHYSGEPGCIAQARGFAAHFLDQLRTEWCAAIGPRSDGGVLLVVSELVTNADRHSKGPYILELEGTGASVAVTVYDSSGAVPERFPKDPERVGTTVWRSCTPSRRASSSNPSRSASGSAPWCRSPKRERGAPTRVGSTTKDDGGRGVRRSPALPACPRAAG